LAALWRQQCLEVGEADRELGEFQASENLPEQCQELIERNQKLLAIGHELRDTLGETLAGMTRAAPAERSRLPAEREADDATLNRSELEGFLAQWWSDHPQGEGHLSVAAVDVDALEVVNQEWGPLAGDHVLRAVSQVLASECGKASPICQFKGDTFVVLMPDVGLHDATTLIERARQQIERTRFSRQARSLQVTVSCGVTETAAGDDAQILKDRVAATLNEAKRYGRNRTFAHEGKYPTPVMPPSFDVAEKSVEL
jgi:diguanylate cyclase (GGDEF)-like protein